MSRRGLFIIVEGCDRSGKSTQCDILVDSLKKNGVNAELVKFPGK
jgi:dTMP kinase